MKFEDFTGFIIAILAMVYFVYQSYQARAAQANADGKSEEQSEVRRTSRWLDMDVNEEVTARPYRQPSPIPKRVEEIVTQLPIPNYVEKSTKRPKEKLVTVENSLASINDRSYEHDYTVETICLPSGIPMDYSMGSEPSRGKVIVNSLASKNDLLVIHDLFGPPKGLW